MARSRFRSDRGLTLRMGGVGLGLGALYVAFGAVLITQTGFALGLVITVGMAWGQWYFSDRLALKSIGGREVSPEQAPELHAMIDRLCVLADMPKPRVAVAVTDMPNAFATGRTPDHSVVCVTTGIMQRLDADELEGVLSHELAHVANRDVSVMTVASSLGLLAGFITRWGFYFGGGNNRGNNNGGGGLPFVVVLLVSMAVYFISFLLTRALSRYRELSADRSGAYLTGRPSKLASALVKISGEMSRIPNKDLRDAQALSAFFFAPAINRESIGAMMSTHPPLQQRLDQLAKVGAELGGACLTMGLLDAILGRTKPPPADLDVLFSVPQAALSLQVAGFTATGRGAVCFRDSEGAVDDRVVSDAQQLIGTDEGAKVEISDDSHGFRWLSVTRAEGDVTGLVTDLHAVNSSLVDAGFGGGLLCSTVLFTAPPGGPCALVYLFKQGTFYPFVPLAGQRRDNALELQVRGLVGEDVPVEAKLDRWLALWGAPGLDPVP